MKIKTKLTLQFSGIFTGILLAFCVSVYYFSEIFRENDFYGRILNRAYATAHYVLDADTVSAQQHALDQRLYFQMLPREVVKVYDQDRKLVFTDGEDAVHVPTQLLQQLTTEGEVRLAQGDRQIVGIRYLHRGKTYFVLASSIDLYNQNKLHHLRTLLLIGFVMALVIVVISGVIFSRAALKPFLKVVSEVEKIKASDLHRRLSQADGQDEVAHLAKTFNNLLDRLETAFEVQKTFVSNASHELRTPLTTMIGELQVALMNRREPEEYERVLKSNLEDAQLLAQLSNGLLQMVQASSDSSKVQMIELRLDELVWQACGEAQKRQPNIRVEVEYANLPEDENELMVKGNEALLLIATVNVLENAAKFSGENQAIFASIEVQEHTLLLKVQDRGIGMAPEDVRKVFVPFFRAESVRDISGHGIGLPLAEKIIKLHRGSISVRSQLNQGTEVTITLPKLFGMYRI
ncbi:sensor histidine kinase [Rufibacter glacialis]|uniref:histidine kinase n=1 Tax=Rufibacter glacialis TaxID=1259555 RepID=A0A5M8QF80_9BACT|nr:HAMP domain-containing sensor histidine kinase [Rufibacter glacialis]KAA6434687.1 HAMP domain-containing histidine kinase [Rufibacter glacialis]GGK71588.1 two-component sensor histidine kinase [Rufibacter glacialis]